MNAIDLLNLANAGGFFGPQGLFILMILLLLFGARKLPELARGLGQAIKEFSKAKNDLTDEITRMPDPPDPKQITSNPVQSAPGTQAHNQENAHHPSHTGTV